MNGECYGHDEEGVALAAEINMTPLIDVMLVLLVVFMVTLPVLHHAAKIALPHASSQREDLRAPHVTIGIDADGRISWDARAVSEAELASRLASAARQTPQPEIRVAADHAAQYGWVAKLLSSANAAGLSKVGFVTDPAAAQK
ncbi:Biopolymer transport protein ExbD/TolR [Burkholderia sp. lig30]|jgi:biopolymer transport protein ExbD|uniref:ExbD/TolR family protein n=1 Tax=Burkholderia sp. lig30 TaxID=1192124 RepID=UPI0004613521|nr:biopolymer transporter ExbD [Burkholderia sp. lig30]KDB10705.1 Biopolymer transport protein ExbD/TolR [Burkholderia sp. lig30]